MIWLLFIGIFILIVVIFWVSPSAEETKRRGFRSWTFWLTTYSILRQRRRKLIDESRKGDYYEPEDA